MVHLVMGHASLAERLYWAVAAAMTLGCVVTLLAAAFDPRTIDGHVSVWVKPLKFEASLAIHAATLALIVHRLGPDLREGSAMWLVAVLFVVACVIEMGWIIRQASIGQQSHFNLSTPVTRAMYSVMAAMAVVIIGAAGAVGLAAASDGATTMSPPVRVAVVIGCVGGTVLTLVTAFTIGSRLSPYVGGVPAHDARMILTGWSLTSGDLRVSHFLSTHMIQVLPLLALTVEGIAVSRLAILFVAASGALWALLTLFEYRVALRGEPSAIVRLLA
jgi:hypothetical protein